VQVTLSTVKARTSKPVFPLVRALVEQVLGDLPDDGQPLLEAGLDSLGAVELQRSLAAAFDISLPSTIVFDYPTVNALAELIESHHVSAEPASPRAAYEVGALELGCEPPMHSNTDLSGLATKFPATRDGVLGFWKSVFTESNIPTLTPLQRWDPDKYYSPDSSGIYVRLGGFIDGIEQFDVVAFGSVFIHSAIGLLCCTLPKNEPLSRLNTNGVPQACTVRSAGYRPPGSLDVGKNIRGLHFCDRRATSHAARWCGCLHWVHVPRVRYRVFKSRAPLNSRAEHWKRK
jgi:acyl carrier protein